jgi:hypothetical protein
MKRNRNLTFTTSISYQTSLWSGIKDRKKLVTNVQHRVNQLGNCIVLIWGGAWLSSVGCSCRGLSATTLLLLFKLLMLLLS